MEEEKISFSVRLKTKEIFRFTFYHEYTRISGIVGLCISLAALAALLVSYNEWSPQTKAILIFASLWYTVIQPVFLWNQARKQAKRNKTKKEPFQYQIDSSGITISQGEAKQTVEWERIFRIVETKSQYLIYSDRVHAFIFPKDRIGISSQDFDEKILGFLGQIRISLKGPIKQMKKQMPEKSVDTAQKKNMVRNIKEVNETERTDEAKKKDIVRNIEEVNETERTDDAEKAEIAEYVDEE